MKISYSLKAADELSDLPSYYQVQITKKMKFFANQSNPMIYAKKLATTEIYRFRISDFRILFVLTNDNSILVISIMRRDKSYRGIERLNLD